MTPKSLQFVRAKDGSERVLLDLAEFQALLDAANIAKHGLPNVRLVVEGLRSALAAHSEYVEADDFLERYDGALVGVE